MHRRVVGSRKLQSPLARRAIVGIEVHITHLEGKRKLSQNRGTADRSGVMAALHERDHRALAQAMQQTG